MEEIEGKVARHTIRLIHITHRVSAPFLQENDHAVTAKIHSSYVASLKPVNTLLKARKNRNQPNYGVGRINEHGSEQRVRFR